MRQGSAKHVSGGYKTEPKANSVNPAAVAQLGYAYGNHTTDGSIVPGANTQMYRGRGLEAPMVGVTHHHSGSQGRHK